MPAADGRFWVQPLKLPKRPLRFVLRQFCVSPTAFVEGGCSPPLFWRWCGLQPLFVVSSNLRRERRLQAHQQQANALIEQQRLISPSGLERSNLDFTTLLDSGTESPLSCKGKPMVLRGAVVSGSTVLVVIPWWRCAEHHTAWRQDRTDQLLLVAAAGGSMLFTALLLSWCCSAA